MKFRQDKPQLSESEEQALVHEIRDLALQKSPLEHPVVSLTYWQSLIVRTNQRIDHVISPMALSISWALRVAIPGVVAVLSFVIGLHYYAPVRPSAENGMNSAVQALADRDVDSMVTSSALADGAIQAAATVGNQVFDVSKDQIVDYLIENERETTLVESLDDQQANALLIALANGTQN